MPFNIADREAHVAIARRLLADVERRGGYPVGHEPKLWLESLYAAQHRLARAERMLRNQLRD